MKEITKNVKKLLFFLIHNPIVKKKKRPDCHFWEYKEFRGISNYGFFSDVLRRPLIKKNNWIKTILWNHGQIFNEI